ncbi:MAG: ACP phosphodiesterase [Pseudomonadaceae bacterium]|nr:ACP phosphodiesterase [Pseudomonadaceae bacterium]
MNFLAHCLLAGARDEFPEAALVAGGVLGDFVKGRPDPSLPPELRAGIQLHRHIDACSNSNTALRQSIARFEPPHRRLAPVYVDLIADHLLARDFERHHSLELEAFTAGCYEALREYRAYFPKHAERFLNYAVDTDLFARYEQEEVLLELFASINRRLKRPVDQSGLAEHVLSRLADLKDDFHVYLPQLRDDAITWQRDHRASAER